MNLNLRDMLRTYDVEIPALQRNYVHGADTPQAMEIRKHFMDEFVKLLSPLSKETFDLNFIYGEKQDGKIIPVDGQQRLTTLWLLAAYIVNRFCDDEKKRNDWRALLEKFSYAGRPLAAFASRCIADGAIYKEKLEESGLCSDITSGAMARTLATIAKYENRLSEYSFEVLEDAIERVTFEFEEIRQSADETYIKMNARGKTLTQWENFKGKFAELLPDDDKKNGLRARWNRAVEAATDEYIALSRVGTPLHELLPDVSFFALVARILLYESGKGDDFPNLALLGAFQFDKKAVPFVPFDEFKAVMDALGKDRFSVVEKCICFIIRVTGNRDDFFSKNYFPYWDSEQKTALWAAIFKPSNAMERNFGLVLYEYVNKFKEEEQDILAVRLITNLLENDASDDRIGDCLKFFANGPTLYGKAISESSVAQVAEEIRKGYIYTHEDGDFVASMQKLEVFLHGRIRIAIFDLSKNIKDGLADAFDAETIKRRTNTTNELLEKWTSLQSDNEREDYFFDKVIPALPFDIQSEVILNFDPTGLANLIRSGNDKCLQHTLVDGKANPVFSGEGSERDWRSVLQNKKFQSIFREGQRIQKHRWGGLYLYWKSHVTDALPISDYRIDLLTDSEFERALREIWPESPEKQIDLPRINDVDTVSFRMENGLRCYLHRNGLSVVAFGERGTRLREEWASYEDVSASIPDFLSKLGQLTFDGFVAQGMGMTGSVPN